MNDKVWFKAKNFGWGWYPTSWQGWSITIIYIVAILSFAIPADQNSHSASDTLISIAIPFIILTTLLLVICYTKGEKPEWRWGNKKSE